MGASLKKGFMVWWLGNASTELGDLRRGAAVKPGSQ